MFGFTGFYLHESRQDFSKEFLHERLTEMSGTLKHTKEQTASCLLTDRFSLAQIGKGDCPPPASISRSSRKCYISIDGTVFNAPELAEELNIGATAETVLAAGSNAVKNSSARRAEPSRELSQEEIVLQGFLQYGTDFFRRCNGNFSIVIFDAMHDTLYLVRDQFGTKPLFYTTSGGVFLFASEMKALMKYDSRPLTLSKRGFQELFGIGPARTPGNAVFDGYYEVKPACCVTVSRYGIRSLPYWSLLSRPHTESYEDTVLHTKELIERSLARELSADPSPCCLLSGGIDSSLVAAYLAKSCKENGSRLTTVSFDFTQNKDYFKASSYQPSQDRPFIEQMVRHIGSGHHFLECGYQTLGNLLGDSMRGADLPNMADIDSSLLYFCGETAKLSPVAYTGECADEVFGGYPWMHTEKPFSEDRFPWSADLSPRKYLLKPDFAEYLDLDGYVAETYHSALQQAVLRPDDTPLETEKRRYSFLNLYWFMETLLNRMDRCARANGLTARIPFADLDLVSYVYNVPFSMKAKGGLVKSLLRHAGGELLPREVQMRQKSPFPKTYHPAYEKMLADRLREIITDTGSPLLRFLDRGRLLSFLDSPKDYGAPWYGQLMCGPQMMAYLIQMDLWIREYNISVQLS